MSEQSKSDALWLRSQAYLREAAELVRERKFEEALAFIGRAGYSLTEAIEVDNAAKEHNL